MEMDVFQQPTGGTYLVLNHSEQCEIYDIRTGELQYILRDHRYGNSRCAVIDGALYDLRRYPFSNTKHYPLLDTQLSRQEAWTYLTSGDTLRTLTDQECSTYYIPSEWKD